MNIHHKDMADIEQEHSALSEELTNNSARLNDRLINFQNHAYQTGVERGKQQVIEANAAAGKIPPTLCTTVHLGANQATIETGHMLNPAGEEVATLTIANHGTEVRLSFETEARAQAVLMAMVVRGPALPTSEYVRLIDHQQVAEENEQLRGLTPDLPPYPPEGGGLPRYGLRWNGPGQPLSVPFDDGYWTPWHLAAARTAELELRLVKLAEVLERIKRETLEDDPLGHYDLCYDALKACEPDLPNTATAPDTDILQLQRENSAFAAVVEFMTGPGRTEGAEAFLDCWNKGDFDAVRENWPEAPVAIYYADPLADHNAIDAELAKQQEVQQL